MLKNTIFFLKLNSFFRRDNIILRKIKSLKILLKNVHWIFKPSSYNFKSPKSLIIKERNKRIIKVKDYKSLGDKEFRRYSFSLNSYDEKKKKYNRDYNSREYVKIAKHRHYLANKERYINRYKDKKNKYNKLIVYKNN